jgi:hypothetical protein
VNLLLRNRVDHSQTFSLCEVSSLLDNILLSEL